MILLLQYQLVVPWDTVLSNRKHVTTLQSIFAQPVLASIRWSDIETLVRSLGGDLEEGSGSRVRMELNGVRAVFHRPHPAPTTDKGTVKSVRRFLVVAGVQFR